MGLESLFTQTLHIIDEDIEFKENSIVEKMMHACPFKGCEAVFPKRYRLEDHINTHTGECPYKCEIRGCKKEYHSRTSLRKHIRALHEKNASLYTSFVRCPYPNCMMELRSKANLDKHYQRLHTGQFQYVCQYCDKGFNKHTQLQNHVYHHTGIPPLRCATCDTGFVYQRDLNRHLRGHRKWNCDVDGCEEVLPTFNALRKHLGTDHTDGFVCEECKRTFKTKYALRVHVLCHLKDTSRLVFRCPCEDCGRLYFQKRNLTSHIKHKHEGKAYECMECGNKLSTKAKLIQHRKLIHEQQKPVQVKKRISPRKTRKDAGIPHQSMAVKLSGATIAHEEEKRLLKNEYKISEADISISALKRRVTKRKSSVKSKCIGCSSECSTIRTVSSQKLKVPEATAVSDSISATPEDTFKNQGHLPLSVKCNVNGLHPTEGNDSSLCYDKFDTKSEDVKQYTDDCDVKDASLCRSKCVSTPDDLQSAKWLSSDNEHVQDEVQNISNKESAKESKPYCDTDDDHAQNFTKEWHEAYDLKKWIFVMTGMMELLCPEISSPCSHPQHDTP